MLAERGHDVAVTETRIENPGHVLKRPGGTGEVDSIDVPIEEGDIA